MTNQESFNELKLKILKGLEKSYEDLLKYKKAKKSKLVVMRGNKIVKIDP